ncbi:MAG TPA: M55 family metallopeptidase [Solirubrobacterales bacterium]|nr:M55 family metallopeptidase [Solirubrobacterales bacterium]
MDVLIAADMEGITGIDDYRDCLPSHPAAYARGRKLMTDEVLIAVEALRAGGVERVAVGDWHMVGTNIERERMPAGVEVRPIADLALAESKPSIAKASGGPLDAIVFIGHHASTLTAGAFSSHTLIWEMEVELNGEPLNEIQIYAQGLAAEGIPVLLASGDQRMLDELGPDELGGAPLVATKEGRGRARASSFEIDATRAELAGAIAAALAAPPRPPPARSYPAELRIAVAGKELARTTVAEPAELLPAIATVFRGSHVSREYRQLAKLLPAGHDSRARALQRRLGSLVATPTMRVRERQWLASPAG